jgi:hypothetical protein
MSCMNMNSMPELRLTGSRQKRKSCERIDGIAALIMGIERASRHEEFRSGCDKRGPLFITLDTWGTDD